MSSFWEIDASPVGKTGLVRWSGEAGAPPEAVYIDFAGSGEVLFPHHFGGKARLEPFPPMRLELKLETFDLDYFQWSGFSFVSERMRDIMALDPSTARFFEVDYSRSEPLPRSKDYQVMEVAANEDVSDAEHSVYEIYLTGEDGRTRSTLAYDVAFRPDAAPKHDLFYDSFFDTILLCTEAFALRMLKAGCTGIEFKNPQRRMWQTSYRTLRGIEEYAGRDPANGSKIMRVVQAIH